MSSHDIEILDTRTLLSLPPAKWLIEGVIPEKSFVGLYGAPASYKSFLALDWSMCISEGLSWLGKYPTRQGPVVYVAAEGGRGIQSRVRAWMAHHSLRDLPAMYWLLNPLYVREDGVVEAFLDQLNRLDVWPELIVLDTLSRSFGGGEENASADMGAFVDQMTRLASGRQMAALVIHHSNAVGSRERGHTAFKAGTDAMYSAHVVEKDSAGHTMRVMLRNDKQKDGAEAEPIYMRPVDVGASQILEETSPPAPKSRIPGGPAFMRTTDMLLVLGAAERGLTWGEWRLATGIDKDRFNRRLRKLKDASAIFCEGDRWKVMPSTADLAGMEE